MWNSEPDRGAAAGLLDVGDQASPLEDRDCAGRLRDAEGGRPGGHRDRRARLVSRAEALGQRLLELAIRGEVPSRAENDAVAPDDEGAVDRREFLDRLLEPGVEDVALGLGVAVERVDDQLVALG